MSVWVDQKYIELLSPRLERFKKSGETYHFRCVICGDSQRKKYKTRAYFYEKGQGYNHYCHNCGASSSFNKFLREYDPELYSQYLTDLLKYRMDDEPHVQDHIKTKPLAEPNPFVTLKTIAELPLNHFAYQYLKDRRIPQVYLERFYYCPRFRQFVNSLIPGKFTLTSKDEARIIIPLVSKQGVIGFQGRALNPTCEVRYITIMLQEDMPRIWNLDKVDFNRKFYVTEGPLDATFLDNALAVCGADLVSGLNQIHADRRLATIVFDSERRNKNIVHQMQEAIKDGWKIVIWPEDFQAKDINEAILGGLTASEIMHIIDTNTYSGMLAELALTNWRRI